MLPIASIGGTFDAAGLWQNLATFFTTAAVWAQHRAQPNRDPVQELTYRLHHPVRHAAAHPIVTLRRKVDRRRQA